MLENFPTKLSPSNQRFLQKVGKLEFFPRIKQLITYIAITYSIITFIVKCCYFPTNPIKDFIYQAFAWLEFSINIQTSFLKKSLPLTLTRVYMVGISFFVFLQIFKTPTIHF